MRWGRSGEVVTQASLCLRGWGLSEVGVGSGEVVTQVSLFLR